MYCSKCGKELPANSQFCDSCNTFQNQKSQLEINYESFKSDVNVVFIASIISLALLYFGFHLIDIGLAIFCLVRYKKLMKDMNLYIYMPDYGKTLNNLKYSRIMAIISLVCSVLLTVFIIAFLIIYFLFFFGMMALPFIPTIFG